MELNWTTFVLEIVNFLILLWILKRFLYRPILDVIAKRRADIQQERAEAEEQLQQARELERQYLDRLSEWEKEKKKAQETLRQELEGERVRETEKLAKSLEDERQKTKRADEKQLNEMVRKVEHQAMEQAAEFAARLLNVFASPELENRLIQLLLDDLDQMDASQKQVIFADRNGRDIGVTVSSAFPLSDDQKKQIEQAINLAAGQPASFHYCQLPELRAGLLISAGGWSMRANLRDELKSFAEFAYATR